MTRPYYEDDLVALYLGDCLEIHEWLDADILVTDPPYGQSWETTHWDTKRGYKKRNILCDDSTDTRDAALALWGDKPGICFGNIGKPLPKNTKMTCIYHKASNAGMFGAKIAGIRRDIEAIYFIGGWAYDTTFGNKSSIFESTVKQASTLSNRHGHPHAKPLDVMEKLISCAPPQSIIADPFAGSGSTLVAAKMLGQRSIGVEMDEHYCEIAAKRLEQNVLPLEIGDD